MRAKSEKNAENCTFSFEHAIFCNIDFANEVNSFSLTPHTHISWLKNFCWHRLPLTRTHILLARVHTHIHRTFIFCCHICHICHKNSSSSSFSEKYNIYSAIL